MKTDRPADAAVAQPKAAEMATQQPTGAVAAQQPKTGKAVAQPKAAEAPRRTRWRDFGITLADGFAMALADSVPGVSGGTVAFILRFYDRLVAALHNLIFGPKAERKAAIYYLLKLGCGWAVGMALAMLVLARLFEARIYDISSFFLGLVVFALPIIAWAERATLKKSWRKSGFLLIGMLAVVLITWWAPRGETGGLDLGALNFGTILYIILAGAVAISAMILPGISGSTLLLIFGLYLPLVAGIRDLLHLNFSALPAIIAFATGAVLGVVLVIRLVQRALTKQRGAMVYLILGLMAGSLGAIVMGPTTLAEPLAPLSLATFSPLMFLLGGALLILLEWIGRRASA